MAQPCTAVSSTSRVSGPAIGSSSAFAEITGRRSVEIQPTDHVLKSAGLARHSACGSPRHSAGSPVNFSQTMEQATSRNAATTRAWSGVPGDATALLYPENTFQSPRRTSSGLERSVGEFTGTPPRSRAAACLVCHRQRKSSKFRLTQTGVYQLYSGEDLVQLLTQAGFQQARFSPKPSGIALCVLARREVSAPISRPSAIERAPPLV
jgi:hypothetical protein